MVLNSTYDQIAPDLARRSLFIRFSILSVYHYLSLSFLFLFFIFLSFSKFSKKKNIRSSVLLIPTLPKPWNQPSLPGVRVLLPVNSIRDQDLGIRCAKLECLCFLVLTEEDRTRKYMHVYRQIWAS